VYQFMHRNSKNVRSYIITRVQDKIILRWLINTKSKAFKATECKQILLDYQTRQFPGESRDGSRNVDRFAFQLIERPVGRARYFCINDKSLKTVVSETRDNTYPI
jgi:hypothetical protein